MKLKQYTFITKIIASAKLAWVILMIFFLTSCASTNQSNRFENIDPDEITEETLPSGSQIVVELEDGSTQELTVDSIDSSHIFSTDNNMIRKDSIKVLTVLSWGDNWIDAETKADIADAAKQTGVEVGLAFGCIFMVVFAGVESDCS